MEPTKETQTTTPEKWIRQQMDQKWYYTLGNRRQTRASIGSESEDSTQTVETRTKRRGGIWDMERGMQIQYLVVWGERERQRKRYYWVKTSWAAEQPYR